MIHAFLMIGQSNMSGRGYLADAKDINTEHIYMQRNGRWQQMFRPVVPDRSFAGVCLAESFAERYAAEHGCDVGLIPCSDGGTSLDQWQEGGELFENAVNCARLAQRSAEIVGILWHQGEADCREPLASTYRERFLCMAEALRGALGLQDVPFLLGGLGDFLTYGEPTGVINRTLEQIAAEDARYGFVPATGLTDRGDALHFDSPSLYEFGLRYYEVYKKLTKGRTMTEHASSGDALARTAMELL
ncbi:MAG: sialate O-acetylesterase [Clostridia bacterium]|nr:sialate O-acetylesterase [Clostridia bacterium]